MAENPRELVRAAQSAELQGDVKRAVENLRKAAELYRQAGNTTRALQLLRHARRLDGSRVDIAEEVNRLEWMPETLLARPGPEDAEDSRLASELERSLEDAPLPELARRQRLIDDALREAGMHAAEAEAGEEKVWVIGTEVAEDLQRLEAQLARVAASIEAPAEAAGAGASPVESAEPGSAGGALPPVEALKAAAASEVPLAAEEPLRPGGPFPPLEAVRLATTDVAPLPPGLDVSPAAQEPEAAPSRRRREQRLIDRGPTRADAALEAWCSFCCRPRAEVGDLVAGPAGAFICKACLGESVSLLGDVVPVPLPPRSRPVEAAGAAMDLVGQAEAWELLERTFHSGARCLLAVGPMGCGKSVWFQQLQRQGRGVLTSVSALEQASTALPLLVEDVDRLDADAHAALAAFLARHPRHTVLLSARGTPPEERGPVLHGEAGRLPVPTTEALAQAVRGVPESLLEHVQVLLPLRQPTQSEYVEIARRRLALREPAVSLSEDVLAAFAAEAVRSPRAGHELHALLNRVPAGTWSLETTAKPVPPPRKGRRKGTP